MDLASEAVHGVEEQTSAMNITVFDSFVWTVTVEGSGKASTALLQRGWNARAAHVFKDGSCV